MRTTRRPSLDSCVDFLPHGFGFMNAIRPELKGIRWGSAQPRIWYIQGPRNSDGHVGRHARILIIGELNKLCTAHCFRETHLHNAADVFR